MRHHRTLDLSNGLLSLFFPGLGQVAQGRRDLGYVHCAWGVAGVVAMCAAPAFGYSRALPAMELFALTAWSVVDAVRGRSL